nr:MAG TPA: hypothetical protein [Caudoviricetes sp.]
MLVHTPAGPVFLQAGDTVPDGATIDDALVDAGKGGKNAATSGTKRRTKAASQPANSGK